MSNVVATEVDGLWIPGCITGRTTCVKAFGDNVAELEAYALADARELFGEDAALFVDPRQAISRTAKVTQEKHGKAFTSYIIVRELES